MGKSWGGFGVLSDEALRVARQHRSNELIPRSPMNWGIQKHGENEQTHQLIPQAGICKV
jgi:hypothetical protein